MSESNSTRPKTGIIAGWGSFPIEVATELLRQDNDVFVVGLNGHASPELETLATEFRWMGVAKMGAHIRFFSHSGVQRVVFAGKIFKDKVLHHGNRHLSNLPDLTSYRVLWKSFISKSKDARDDTILSAIAEFYEKRGIQVLPIQKVAPKLLVSEGLLTRRKQSRNESIDVAFGWEIARQMGALDIGQSITVKDQMVLGVEAIEGTDALIQRTAALCPRGGFTLIKIAKPNQDMRFDVPTIGRRTVEQMARAGGRSIAIEAGKTLLVERDETLDTANRLEISIVARVGTHNGSTLNGNGNASISTESINHLRAA